MSDERIRRFFSDEQCEIPPGWVKKGDRLYSPIGVLRVTRALYRGTYYRLNPPCIYLIKFIYKLNRRALTCAGRTVGDIPYHPQIGIGNFCDMGLDTDLERILPSALQVWQVWNLDSALASGPEYRRFFGEKEELWEVDDGGD